MFNVCHRSDAENDYEEEDDYAGEVFSVTWERYNTKIGKVEDSIDIEPHEADGLEAVEILVDVKKPKGQWIGFRYVYLSNGVEKHIRPVDYKG